MYRSVEVRETQFRERLKPDTQEWVGLTMSAFHPVNPNYEKHVNTPLEKSLAIHPQAAWLFRGE